MHSFFFPRKFPLLAVGDKQMQAGAYPENKLGEGLALKKSIFVVCRDESDYLNKFVLCILEIFEEGLSPASPPPGYAPDTLYSSLYLWPRRKTKFTKELQVGWIHWESNPRQISCQSRVRIWVSTALPTELPGQGLQQQAQRLIYFSSNLRKSPCFLNIIREIFFIRRAANARPSLTSSAAALAFPSSAPARRRPRQTQKTTQRCDGTGGRQRQSRPSQQQPRSQRPREEMGFVDEHIPTELMLKIALLPKSVPLIVWSVSFQRHDQTPAAAAAAAPPHDDAAAAPDAAGHVPSAPPGAGALPARANGSDQPAQHGAKGGGAAQRGRNGGIKVRTTICLKKIKTTIFFPIGPTDWQNNK